MKKGQTIGTLSIVLGGISFLPFLGIVAPVGLVLGVLGIIKRQFETAIIGTVVSVVGVLTSPFLWVMTAGAVCGVLHCEKPVLVHKSALISSLSSPNVMTQQIAASNVTETHQAEVPSANIAQPPVAVAASSVSTVTATYQVEPLKYQCVLEWGEPKVPGWFYNDVLVASTKEECLAKCDGVENKHPAVHDKVKCTFEEILYDHHSQ